MKLIEKIRQKWELQGTMQSKWGIVDNYGDKCKKLWITMLIGEYSHSIDQKGRLAIPAKFRQALTQGAVVTRGIDKCLFVYAAEQWRQLAEKLMNLPLSQANSRAFARLMLAGAMDAGLDSQGRILVPDYLRKYAGLSKKVVIAGLYNRLEIWDAQEWQIYKDRTERESGDIAEKLSELGI